MALTNAGATTNFVTSGGARGSVVTGLSAHAYALAVAKVLHPRCNRSVIGERNHDAWESN